jgi:hypothetical protein
LIARGFDLQHFPSSIAAGLTFAVDLDLDDHPAPEWAVIVILAGPEKIELTSVPYGDLHRLSVPATQTTSWPGGLYAASVRAVSGADVVEVDAGQVKITADLATVDGAVDPRSHAQRMLDAIEAVLEKRASLDQQSYTIAGRSLVRTPILELQTMRDAYRKEVGRLSANGKPRRLLGRRINVRFGG